jgi:hypothetical protein
LKRSKITLKNQLDDDHHTNLFDFQTSLNHYVQSIEALMQAVEERRNSSTDSSTELSLQILEQILQQLTLLKSQRISSEPPIGVLSQLTNVQGTNKNEFAPIK